MEVEVEHLEYDAVNGVLIKSRSNLKGLLARSGCLEHDSSMACLKDRKQVDT
jgi:BMFP domain-containing protein YqiC